MLMVIQLILSGLDHTETCALAAVDAADIHHATAIVCLSLTFVLAVIDLFMSNHAFM